MNRIGLDEHAASQLVEGLDELLANYQILYQNVRGYHWNIRGDKFFELHVKFETTYTDLLTKVDEVAERILTLGGTPSHSYSSYLKNSGIKEQTGVHDGITCVTGLLDSYKTLLKMQRALLAQAAEANDEGTVSLLSDYIGFQEKEVWMLSAYIA
ncbi:Dps family protein [Celerinatantimonas yamalensis]|uniref:Dps family protein n=1 Tax=Celerinatantimonas yamalensis TaxID=559956 RepID=A0ABW9GD65_9GAMM